MASSSPRKRRYGPLFDVHPVTGDSIEVFYADRTLESFGRLGAGWYWWSRQARVCSRRPGMGPSHELFGISRRSAFCGRSRAIVGDSTPASCWYLCWYELNAKSKSRVFSIYYSGNDVPARGTTLRPSGYAWRSHARRKVEAYPAKPLGEAGRHGQPGVHMTSSCILCRIRDGSVPVKLLYRDEFVYATDVPESLRTPSRPRAFHRGPQQACRERARIDGRRRSDGGRLFTVAAELARRKGIADSGFRLATNTGPDANQTVFHFHLHCIGGRKLGREG